VQENVYDGRNFRIIKKTYTSGVLDETRHIYYTSSWQAIEERLGTDPDSADAALQYVWGIRYIDDLVLRDRDTSELPDGVLNERLHAIQDPNWNVTTIIDDSGNVQERYEYEAYGQIIYLTREFLHRELTSYGWSHTYSGYVLDGLTSTYSVRARVLSCILGRWMSMDNVSALDSLSLYEYVRSSPLARIDPSGAFSGVTGAKESFSLKNIGTGKFAGSLGPPDPKQTGAKIGFFESVFELNFKLDQQESASLGCKSLNFLQIYHAKSNMSLGSAVKKNQWTLDTTNDLSPFYTIPQNGTNASMHDIPGLTMALQIEVLMEKKYIRYEFETCVVCRTLAPPPTYCVLGCITWGHDYYRDSSRESLDRNKTHWMRWVNDKRWGTSWTIEDYWDPRFPKDRKNNPARLLGGYESDRDDLTQTYRFAGVKPEKPSEVMQKFINSHLGDEMK